MYYHTELCDIYILTLYYTNVARYKHVATIMFISSVFGFHATLDSRIAPVPGDIDRVREWP